MNVPGVKVGDINMYYEVQSEGEALVNINCVRASLELSYRLIPIFSGECRLVLFDNTGKSTVKHEQEEIINEYL